MHILPTTLTFHPQTDLHGHPLYLVCPDVLSLVGELLAGDGCGSLNYILFSYFLFYLLIYLFIYS